MFLNITDYPAIDDAWTAYPGAIAIVEVCGGWHVFMTATDQTTWENQA